MPGLFGCRSRGALTQLLARRLTSPGPGVDIAHCAQPLFSFGQRGEIPHVQPKPLAAFLEATAHEKAEALQLRLLRARKREGCRRRTQVENERACVRGLRRSGFPGILAHRGARRVIGLRCHKTLPRTETSFGHRTASGEFATRRDCERSRWQRDRGSPAVIGTSSFRPVALRPRLSTGLPLSLQGPSVKASRMTVKCLYCVQHLSGCLYVSRPSAYVALSACRDGLRVAVHNLRASAGTARESST